MVLFSRRKQQEHEVRRVSERRLSTVKAVWGVSLDWVMAAAANGAA